MSPEELMLAAVGAVLVTAVEHETRYPMVLNWNLFLAIRLLKEPIWNLRLIWCIAIVDSHDMVTGNSLKEKREDTQTEFEICSKF